MALLIREIHASHTQTQKRGKWKEGDTNLFLLIRLVKSTSSVVCFLAYCRICDGTGYVVYTADLVQKLIDNGKQLLAVKFIFEFGLTDKFQPVPLLKDHLLECKKITKDICKDGKNSIKAQVILQTP